MFGSGGRALVVGRVVRLMIPCFYRSSLVNSLYASIIIVSMIRSVAPTAYVKGVRVERELGVPTSYEH